MMSPLNILNTPNSAVDSTTPASSHSPDLSKSPSSMILNGAAAAAAAAAAAGGLPLPIGPLPGAAAASLLHAFGNNSANALAQMFPGFPLHMAAAAAAAFYGQPHPHQAPPTSQGPFTHIAPPNPGQFSPQQQQQVNSLLAAARENQILAQLNQKKMHEESHMKQSSPQQSMPPPPPSSNSMISPSNFQNRGPAHPLAPLAMMARGQQNSPQNHQQNILSPSLYNQSFKRKLPAESADVPTSCPSSTSESTFSLFNRMASAAGTSSANSPVSLMCPICNISLDGVDVSAHFYEEMHKIDSLRKMAEWSKAEENDKAAKIKDGASPYEKFTSLQHSPAGNGNLYQKKLQLPQSRWETFQRIRQNRHTRLAAFMRFTRRKYEAAYDPTGATGLPAQFPFPHPPMPSMMAVSHHSPSASSSASSSGGGSHRSPVSASQSANLVTSGQFNEHGIMSQKISPVSSAGNDSSNVPNSAAGMPQSHIPPSAQQFPHPFLHPALSSFYQYNQLLSQGGQWPPAAYPFNGTPEQFFTANGTPKIWRNIDTNDNNDARSDTSKRSLEDDSEFVSSKQIKKEDNSTVDETELDVESVPLPPRAASHCSSISSSKSEHSSAGSCQDKTKDTKASRNKDEDNKEGKDNDDDELDVVSSDCESPAPESLRHFSNPHRLYSSRRFDDNSVSGTESVA